VKGTVIGTAEDGEIVISPDGRPDGASAWQLLPEHLEKIEPSSKTETKPRAEFRVDGTGIYKWDSTKTDWVKIPSLRGTQIERIVIDEWAINKPLTKKPTIMSKAITFVKNQALKATNPDEFQLREAGLHDSCGELTSEGESLHMELLRELTREKMVGIAKEMNTEKKESK
jgi:hypothetical protein